MALAHYHVGVDWNQDGDYTDLDEQLDRRVIAVEWALGLDDPSHVVAAPSWATITLRDRAGDLVPDNSGGSFYGDLTPHKAMRITSKTGGTTTTHFTGWIESITPEADNTTVIRCTGVETLLQRAEVFAHGHQEDLARGADTGAEPAPHRTGGGRSSQPDRRLVLEERREGSLPGRQLPVDERRSGSLHLLQTAGRPARVRLVRSRRVN